MQQASNDQCYCFAVRYHCLTHISLASAHSFGSVAPSPQLLRCHRSMSSAGKDFRMIYTSEKVINKYGLHSLLHQYHVHHDVGDDRWRKLAKGTTKLKNVYPKRLKHMRMKLDHDAASLNSYPKFWDASR